LGGVISPVFDVQDKILDHSEKQLLSIANLIHSTKLKAYLDEELIVKLHDCELIDYDPRENILAKMESLDKDYCKSPVFQV
jgi:hypothetical protein